MKLYSEHGKGTTFTVKIPLEQEHAPEIETLTDEGGAVSDDERPLKDDRDERE